MTKSASTQLPRPSRYSASDGAIIGRNQPRCFNRPLYIDHQNAFLLAGDRPALRFAKGETLHGTLFFCVTHDGVTTWLHDWADLTMEYRPAQMRWTARQGALTLVLAAVALEGEVGFAVKLSVEGAIAGDQVRWAFGGAREFPGRHLNWDLDPYCEPQHLPTWFDPAFCAGNLIRVTGAEFVLRSHRKARPHVVGCTDAQSAPVVLDGGETGSPSKFFGPQAEKRPLVSGVVDPVAQQVTHWHFRRGEQPAGRRRRVKSGLAPAAAFASGMARSAALQRVIEVDTPDARLNAAAVALSAAIDGAWYAPTFRHGAMLWNVPYVGWRTACGGTALGWHDRVKTHGTYYLSHQEKSSKRRSNAADPKVMLTIPAPDSRFYGRGRITQDQGIYNMQSQLFDQLIHAWHWTGDAELERMLRPALELHLEWLHACFDPDDDGLFESVINVWPTDSVWYTGGGATEETSYAYRAHVAARELARRAGDRAAAKRHGRQLARIRSAFRRKLWVKSKGRAGLYCERHSPQRLHDDPWLYGIFLPIDAGLVNREQAAESLLFAERGLQNDHLPCGGRKVWTSNFVPAIWSVREVWPGDNYHLALAYFQTGLGEDGWDIFRGTLLHSAFDNVVPGDWADRAGGTDFGDSVHMGARALVEGLFGFMPDRPHGIVRVSPQFPSDWHHANLRTADVSLRWKRHRDFTSLGVSLTQPARLEVRIPICARGIKSVTANGGAVKYTLEAGFGRTWVCLKLAEANHFVVEITALASAPVFPALNVRGRAGAPLTLRAKSAAIESFTDPQAALSGAKVSGGKVTGRYCENIGDHSVFARVRFGAMPQIRRFHISIWDPAAERATASKQLIRAPARANWECVDLSSVLNGDIRTIYAQKYLTPRPPTMSAQIGTDGYSPWTFPYWDSHPPVITLDGVANLLVEGRLMTTQGVPFRWSGVTRNILFTSRWDNWPTAATIPVGRAAAAAWFLVCGSTNPMQGKVANAVLRMRYAEGADETLELVPPFNYWNHSPIRPNVTAPMQFSRNDYTSEIDAFCVPKPWPQTVQLGENCRAMLLSWKLRKGAVLKSVTLETLSADVVVGLMGVSLMNPRR